MSEIVISEGALGRLLSAKIKEETDQICRDDTQHILF